MSNPILLKSVQIFPALKGEHNSELAYSKMDEVQYQTSIYRASEDIPAGVAITDSRWVIKLDNRTAYTAEQGRVTAETSRASAETSRASAETSRGTAEGTRASNETARGTAESGRATAEQGRVSAESSRTTAESGRATAESGRVSAESGRASAETARASAETTRAAFYEGFNSQLAANTKQSNVIANLIYRPSLSDLYQDAVSRLMENLRSLDVEKPARTYTIQFAATTGTTALQLPLYSALTTISDTDNDTFLADKAYVSDIVKVYDLTADPNRVTSLYSSFVRGTRTITLTAASDGTERTWEVVCLGVPYQGLMPQLAAHTPSDTRFRVIYDPGTMMILADGLSATEFSPFISRLPLNGSSASDAYSGNIRTVAELADGKYSFLPIIHSANSRPPRAAPSLIFSANASGIRGVNLSAQYIWFYGAPLNTFPNPYLTCYFCLVQAVKQVKNAFHDDVFLPGEILLFASTQICTNKYPYLRTSDAANAGDVFRLPGRPTYSGEVNVL